MNVITLPVEGWQKRDVKDPLRYSGLVLKVCHSLAIKNGLDVNDIMGNAWIQLISYINNIDKSKSKSSYAMRAILHGAMFGVSITHYGKKQESARPYFVNLPEIDSRSKEDVFFIFNDKAPDLFTENIIALIKDIRYFDDFMLHYKGKTYEEISKESKVTRQRVEQRINMFRLKAADRLKVKWNELGIDVPMEHCSVTRIKSNKKGA